MTEDLTDILIQNGYSREDIADMPKETIEEILNLIFDAQSQGNQPPNPPPPSQTRTQPEPDEDHLTDINGGFDDGEALNIAIALSQPPETPIETTNHEYISGIRLHSSDSLSSISLENDTYNDEFAKLHNDISDKSIDNHPEAPKPSSNHPNVTNYYSSGDSNSGPSFKPQYTTFTSDDSASDYNPVNIENFDESSDKERNFHDSATRNRMIVQEQDREYQEAQRLAREAVLSKEKERQDKQLELSRIENQSEEIIEALLELPPEPNDDNNNDNIVKIAVQFPTRRRETRNFFTNELGKDVYIWVTSLTMNLDINDPSILYLGSYDLVDTTRNPGILDKNRSLEDQRYTQNTLFMIDIL